MQCLARWVFRKVTLREEIRSGKYMQGWDIMQVPEQQCYKPRSQYLLIQGGHVSGTGCFELSCI